jgi:hypothetical protein
MISKFEKTEKPIITIVPTVQRLYAIHMLKEEGIPYETVRLPDMPEDVIIECVFRGEEYKLNNIVGVKAPVTSKSLIAALEARTDNRKN